MYLLRVVVQLLPLLPAPALAFSPAARKAVGAPRPLPAVVASRTRVATALGASAPPPGDAPPRAAELKSELLDRLRVLRDCQARDGDFDDVDWGVKGGELNRTAEDGVATPAQLDYYAISEDVGRAADEVLSICDSLSGVNPTDEPTRYLGDRKNGHLAPLDGTWRNLFSNAADASFSSKGKRGAASPRNVVDAKAGRITNVIDFATLDDGTEPVLKQLNVRLKAKAVGKRRVRLWFLFVKPVVTKFFGIPLGGRTVPLYFPIRPISWVVYALDFIRRAFRWLLRREAESKILQVYFDVLYLDRDLRIHKTGQDNVFVQAKESWQPARPLFQ